MRNEAVEVTIRDVRADHALEAQRLAVRLRACHALREAGDGHTDVGHEYAITSLPSISHGCHVAASPGLPDFVETLAVLCILDLRGNTAVLGSDGNDLVEVLTEQRGVGPLKLQEEHGTLPKRRLEDLVGALHTLRIQQLASQHGRWVNVHRTDDGVHGILDVRKGQHPTAAQGRLLAKPHGELADDAERALRTHVQLRELVARR
mmetsp:Transcript_96347/g.276674  ORF Transcript_96347/g.276674 Transcript_96347/m.276674 type:complete len:205 (-) Transcript_96347:648-1262(-)